MLLQITTVGPSKAPLKRDVDDFLKGHLPASSMCACTWLKGDRLHLRHHQFPIYRRGHHLDHDNDPLLHPLPR
ncbi:hypothetical protein GUJ93_ZPchr0010g9666 [Zizania palustris]|uniref:Uncharacterized protein n=1 Tax=Zizania palustris TaxID=103762 RepID=A0A8J6BAA4_ZIZPA|nr:hypothetical protein GUJ93_ZPchr0010g9666 [Zizania palustris]